MFYTFEQNNGSHELEGEKYIIIHAESAVEANNIALLNGIYFNGVNSINGRRDCPICGDRWKQVKDSDGKSLPNIHGMNPESYKDSWVIIKKDNTKYYTIEEFEYSNQEKISDDERFSSEKERNKALARLMN